MLNASNDFVGRMPLGFQPFDQSGDFLTGHFLHATSLPFRSEVLLSLPYKYIIQENLYNVKENMNIFLYIAQFFIDIIQLFLYIYHEVI